MAVSIIIAHKSHWQWVPMMDGADGAARRMEQCIKVVLSEPGQTSAHHPGCCFLVLQTGAVI